MPESASRGRGVSALGGSALGGVSAPLGGVCSGGGLLRGGVCSWGVSTRGVSARGGVCSRGGGGGIPACTEADTPPWTESQTPVKTLPWPNFVAAGNK